MANLLIPISSAMLKAPIPLNEKERQLELLSYGILDSEEEEDYTALVELAANICNCTSATITFIDKERQWFKARKNIVSSESSRDFSFCGHVIMHEEVMVVDNASIDKRFSDNPDVIGGLKIGFYAGAPIISSAGYQLGTVCVIDHDPKADFSESQKRALETIASQVKRLLELRIKSRMVQIQSEELIQSEKNTARLNMLLQEKKNDDIAYELHENIAQITAAAKMYAEMVADDNDYSKESSAKLMNYLSVILHDVRALSMSITPTTFSAADYTGYIYDLALKTGKEKNIYISINGNIQDIKLRKQTGLAVYRIFQYILNYAELAGSTSIDITPSTSGTESIILLAHNGSVQANSTDNGIMLLNNIRTRADIISAKFEHSADFKKMELLFRNED